MSKAVAPESLVSLPRIPGYHWLFGRLFSPLAGPDRVVYTTLEIAVGLARFDVDLTKIAIMGGVRR
ncbi:hypothetical protein L914_12653 [Phytophthora nicotianae]|uniref:Uncharacterized protein n=1 Tax=Phytophthora nicotianae TaxID=4792 RepID=W2MZ66_PHYNI|nr:hypothetical protein L914_12653 [Phytophthora nicotianae]